MNHPFHIAIGRLWQETNTFAETRTTLREFQQYTWQVGDALLSELTAQDNELAGFADVLGPACVPLLNASAWCGGPLEEDVVRQVTDTVIDQLQRATNLDAVLFSLHGAMAGQETFDVEGHLLRAIRQCLGPDFPVVITLDHHANVTRAMVESVTALTGYRYCPHTDMRETGRRGARLLLSILRDEIKPVLAYRKIPLVTPCEHFRTAEGPMKMWFDLAAAIERRPGMVDAAPFPVQPWLDVPEHGWSVVVTANGDQSLAEQGAAELANWAWQQRREFFAAKLDPAEAVRTAAASSRHPVVLADGADATNGGSPGDSTCLLREFCQQQIRGPALLTMVDPEVVDQAYRAGAGATIEVNIGAKRSRQYHQPLHTTARVIRFADGKFQLTGHLAMKVNMGRCVLLAIGPVQVVVSEFAGPGHDPAVYRHIGLEPRDAQIVVVKATVGHLDAYRDIMAENIPVECPGLSPSYLERLEYRRIPRPMYPFDKKMEWPA